MPLSLGKGNQGMENFLGTPGRQAAAINLALRLQTGRPWTAEPGALPPLGGSRVALGL